MCFNPDTYEFRLSLDLPQQSAVPTDTFSALREVHEHSAENGPRFHTAAEMFDSLVRARAGFAVVGAAIGKTSIIERLHCVIVGGLERHMNRRDGIALGCSAHPHGGTILGHKSLNTRESRALAVAH